MPEAPWGRHTRWLTIITVDPEQFGAPRPPILGEKDVFPPGLGGRGAAGRETIRLALEVENIEARPVWAHASGPPTPQRWGDWATPPELGAGGRVAEELFERGLCLPSGSNLGEADLERVAEVVRRTHIDGVLCA